ncbi:uncharacterized protein [Diadema antillarum]|uniref:uncharacterized protein n=1 Tax=Diadema antillarum TaxID=105358 RepID=UPI003A87D445
MNERTDAVIFWTKDESDGDFEQDKMTHRGAHVPGVTDTASRPTMEETTKKFLKPGVHRQKTMPSKLPGKMDGGGNPSSKRKQIGSQNTAGDSSFMRPSLKDLQPEDKKRVANLIRELAKLGEEKEVAMEQLQVERREHDLRTKDMQDQVVDILKERESLQLQLLECQKLLAGYQTRVSQEQKSPLGSLQDHSSTTKEASRSPPGRSPIKESAQIIPTSDRHSDSYGGFVQLHSVPDNSSVASSLKTETNNISVKTPASVDHNMPKGIDGEFTPALSSTHRPHHLQSRSVKNAELNETLIDYGGENAMSYQLSPSVTGNAKPNLRKHHHSHPLIRNGDGLKGLASTRASLEDFRPLQEEKDSTKSSSKRNMSSSRDASQSQHWASLPEMDTHHSYGHQEGGQQVPHHQKVAGVPYDDDNRHGQVLTVHSPQKAMPGALGYPDPRTSRLRQQDLGLLRVKLQKEQEWLQHKLAEQERLLQQKQREIQAQKQQLGRMGMTSHHDDGRFLPTGYEGRHLPQHRETRHGEHRTKMQEDQRTGVFVDRMNGHAERYWRREPDGRQGMIGSPWRQSIVDAWNEREEEISTNYPPPDVMYHGRGHPGDMERDGYISSTQNGGYRMREDDYYEEYRDYDPVEEEEEQGEVNGELWYQMRAETEGGYEGDNIQGYASLHRPINGRHPGKMPNRMAANSATSQLHQSYRITDSASHLPNAMNVTTNRAQSSSLPQKQIGSISALLDEDFDQSHPPQLHKTKPRADVRMSQQHGPYLAKQPRPGPSPQSHQRYGPRGVREAYDVGSGPRRKPIYSQVDRRSLLPSNTRGRHTGVANHSNITDQEQRAKSSVSSTGPRGFPTAAAHADVTKSHLVQRSHDVIREIGRLLNEDADPGDEEESKVLEEVFFLG